MAIQSNPRASLGSLLPLGPSEGEKTCIRLRVPARESETGRSLFMMWLVISLTRAYLRRMLKSFEFCIPTKSTTAPSGPDWLHGVKYDGLSPPPGARRRPRAPDHARRL